jgi:yecA family protein
MTFETSYQTLEEIAPCSSSGLSAAELHGILTGMLCVDPRVSCEQWVSHAFGGEADDLASADTRLLETLCDETRRLLTDEDYPFDLFLPDEEASLSIRTEALAEWCQGFLYGLGYGIGDAEWPGDCTELLQDIQQISQLDSELSPDDTEEAYSELHEFVRVGVLVIRSELGGRSPPTRLH